MTWLKKAKFSLALMLGTAFFTATDAYALKISEMNKIDPVDQASYIIDVMNEHLKLVANKNLDLAKKTEIVLYTPSSKMSGVSQGIVSIMGTFKYFEEKNLADKVDVELACRLLMDEIWKKEGWTHEGKIANVSMFIPKGFQVAYNPTWKKDGDKNIDKGDSPPSPKKTSLFYTPTLMSRRFLFV